MNRTPILIREKSFLTVEDDGEDSLCVRTKLRPWWPGAVIVFGILLWGSGAVYRLLLLFVAPADLVPQIAFPPWPVPLFFTLIFGGLFYISFTSQRLRVEKGELEYEWLLRPFVLERKRAKLVQLLRTNYGGDEGSDYLSLETVPWSASFSISGEDATLEEVRTRLQELWEKG